MYLIGVPRVIFLVVRRVLEIVNNQNVHVLPKQIHRCSNFRFCTTEEILQSCYGIKMKLLLIKNCFCICVVYMQDLKKKMKVSFFLDFDSSHNWELEI